MISRWVVGVVLLFGILLMMLPDTDEKSLAKIASTSMLMCSSDFREQVASQVLRDEPVSVEFKNPCPDLIATVEVVASGDMVITGKTYPLMMRLIPVVEEGKVRWSCRGEPTDMVTNLCKV